jgi:hypothetical protein
MPSMQPSLIDRLQKIQVAAPESLPDFPKYAVEEMDSMKVEFGTKHLGHRYLDVWNGDQSWIVWFLKHYSQSVKTAHRLMVYYIECKIERAELEGKQVLMTVPATSSPMTSSVAHGKPLHTQAKAKAKSAPMPCQEIPIEHPELQGWEMDDVELFEDMGAQIERSQMEARMNNMENAINSILLHLEQMAPAPQHMSASNTESQ